MPPDKEIAEKARAFILADLGIYDSIRDFAEQTGTNPFKLNQDYTFFDKIKY
jgi:hypothetical protein